MFIQFAALLLAGAAFQPEPNTRESPIIVTGERIRDLEAALSACLARDCPPNEDVDATLALAEGQFLNGDYEDAEDAIRASLDRNGRHVRRYPEPVADLFRSQARVQSHRGRDTQAAQSTYGILRSLRAGIPAEDHRHFTARLEIVQMETRAGNRNGVRRELRELIDAARRAGREDVVRLAEMRLLQFSFAQRPYGEPLRRLQQLAASADPQQRFESVSARFTLSRYYRDKGDSVRADALLAGIPPSQDNRRALLYSPPYELVEGEHWANTGLTGSPLRRLSDNFHDTWIDVGYWIESNGRVSGVEILRQGSSSEWAAPLLASIKGRIFAASADSTPSYRLERYTYTSQLETVTGSRLVRNSRRARAEYLDLTTPAEPGRAPDAGVPPGAK